ncbi:MAG: hypothetical protein RLZZ175_3353 [Bacteroidota bacterium]|jgi:hypothetical protein
MRVLNLIYLGAIALCLTLASCKGEKGDVGPAGTNGTNGTDGNSEVTHDLVTVKTTDWVWDNATNNWTYKYSVPNTPNSLSLVYGYVTTGQGNAALPYIDFNDGSVTSFFNNLYLTNQHILITIGDGSNTFPKPTTNILFTFITLPPAKYIRSDNSELDYTNYESVKKFYNLKQ